MGHGDSMTRAFDEKSWVDSGIDMPHRNSMAINEIFQSVQGEGLFAGEPTTFIRMQYCPYDCNWCDSKRTWKLPTKSQFMKIPDIVAQCTTKHICITGGEPLAQPLAFESLIRRLKPGFAVKKEQLRVTVGNKIHTITSMPGRIVSVETSGLHILPGNNGGLEGYGIFGAVDSWVIDVKLIGAANAKVGKKFFPIYSDLSRLRYLDQVKFVVANHRDLDEVLSVLRLYPTPAVKLISPMNPTIEKKGVEHATINLAWHKTVIEFCIQFGFRYSPQVHKFVGVR